MSPRQSLYARTANTDRVTKILVDLQRFARMNKFHAPNVIMKLAAFYNS